MFTGQQYFSIFLKSYEKNILATIILPKYYENQAINGWVGSCVFGANSVRKCV